MLVIQRSLTVLAGGKICFPGGSVEVGETIEQAVIREMWEELGVTVSPVRELWQCTIKSGTRLHWWLVDLPHDAVFCPDPDEVDTYAWLTVSQIKRLPQLLPSNADFFTALEAREFELPIE